MIQQTMKTIFLSLATLLITSCADGTGTGNPIQSASGQHTTTGAIASKVCSVISQCHPEVTFDVCQNGIANHFGFSEKLGLPANSLSLSQIIEAEMDQSLNPNIQAVEICTNHIKSLSCSHPSVIEAYEELNMGAEFAKSPEILGNSCQGVFGSNP